MAKYTIRPSNVYTTRPEIPPGWTYAGFRPPTLGEKYLFEPNTGTIVIYTAEYDHILPAVIVRRTDNVVDWWWE